MQILSVCGIAVAAAVISLLVKQYKPEYAPAVAVVASVTVLTAALKAAIPVAAEYFGIAAETAGDMSAYGIMFKSLGITYLTVFAADTCRDAGQNSLAAKVELAGRLAVVATALPLVKRVVSIVTELLK